MMTVKITQIVLLTNNNRDFKTWGFFGAIYKLKAKSTKLKAITGIRILSVLGAFNFQKFSHLVNH